MKKEDRGSPVVPMIARSKQLLGEGERETKKRKKKRKKEKRKIRKAAREQKLKKARAVDRKHSFHLLDGKNIYRYTWLPLQEASCFKRWTSSEWRK